MRFAVDAFASVGAFGRVNQYLSESRTPVAAFGLSYIHRVLLAAALRGAGRKVLLIASGEGEARRAADDLAALCGECELFPARDISFYADEASREYERARTGVLAGLLRGECSLLVTTAPAAAEYTVPPEVLESRIFRVRAGEKLEPEELAHRLTLSGYEKVDRVENPGEFSRRGGIFDCYSPGAESPYRLEFFDDCVESIHLFDPATQRRGGRAEELTVSPPGEIYPEDPAAFAAYLSGLAKRGKRGERFAADAERAAAGLPVEYDRYFSKVYSRKVTLADYLAGFTVVFADTGATEERFRKWEELLATEAASAAEDGILPAGAALPAGNYAEFARSFEGFPAVYAEPFVRSRYAYPPKATQSFVLTELAPWNGQTPQLAEELTGGGTCVILGGSEKSSEELARRLSDGGMSAVYARNPSALGKGVTVTAGRLSAGFAIPEKGFTLLPYFGPAAKRRRERRRGVDISAIEDLRPGDLVVHSSHGIGRYEGVTKLKTLNGVKDYIKIAYRDGGVLYVPVMSLDLISKYIGSADENVKLNDLSSGDWNKTKARARSAVKDIAEQLTKLYAKRMAQPGYSFPEDDDMQRDFESRFPYEETEDQLVAAREIKDDMERDVPMDRLLCGDVGVGKTEVAFRAAFKCVEGGKQCALLVPTTVLAWQHYNTARERFEGFPVNVAMLSRFNSPKEQKKVKEDLREGRVDFLIGTHRMIGRDVEFRDLGLLIIDEEQRFGVEQKERLKEKFPKVDVLTLSATPIPRTLNMSLSGLRDMSSIEEPPADRFPVQTFVMERDDGVLYAAIERELARGGQVYWLHNRIESVYAVGERLAARFPDAAVAVAHGKMGEEELSEVWRKLVEREVDILVCTTIIEAGVDVPNVNTLIVENADRFGLSQLHQLRGRVGRSRRRAYAYFCYPPFKSLTETAAKRLDAVRRYTEFGSGFKIAMSDLEIRGAGNLLGGEQHGTVGAVGYDMYMRLLNDALAEQRGEEVKEKSDCTVDIRLSARLPESYIPFQPERLELYKRISSVENAGEAEDLLSELRDRFGEPPREARDLVSVALCKNRAAAAGITEIRSSGQSVLFFMERLDTVLTSELIKRLRGRVLVNAGKRPYIAVRNAAGGGDLATLREVVGE